MIEYLNKNIPVKNIYYMLAYAFQHIVPEEDKRISAESFDNLHDLLAVILATGISYQLKRGLHREYQSVQENIKVVKGRINVGKSISNIIRKRQEIFCEYDELTENNIYNQILKTAVFYLLRCGKIRVEHAVELRKLMMLFTDVDILFPDTIKWGCIYFTRNNMNYRWLIHICHLIITELLMTTDDGDCYLKSFIDQQKFHRLFEKFILEYYIREFPQLYVRSAKIEWALDDDVVEALPKMQSDIMISYKKYHLIIDAKCYAHNMQQQFEKYSVRSNHLYQIFAYVKNFEYNNKQDSSNVSGLLCYVKTSDEVQPDFNYQMSGNKIGIKTIDLGCDFECIMEQLNRIVFTYFPL